MGRTKDFNAEETIRINRELIQRLIPSVRETGFSFRHNLNQLHFAVIFPDPIGAV
jgi:hypothetical protein